MGAPGIGKSVGEAHLDRARLVKDGRYLYIDPERRVVIVRQGGSTGDFSWVELCEQVAASVG